MNGAEKLLDAVDWEPLPPMEAKDGELYATHQGYLTIGAIRLKCYTLNNAQRVFDADSVHQLFSDERVPESEEPR